jgi:hypothetical protein
MGLPPSAAMMITLHHHTGGIERRKILFDDTDRNNFIDRVGSIVTETNTACYGWALILNLSPSFLCNVKGESKFG